MCVFVLFYLSLIKRKNVSNLPTKRNSPHSQSSFCFLSHSLSAICNIFVTLFLKYFSSLLECMGFLFFGLYICFLVFLHLSVSFTTLAEGRLEVNMSEVSLENVERSLLEKDSSIAPGGYWKPRDCLPRWKVSADVWRKAPGNTQTDKGGHVVHALPSRWAIESLTKETVWH